MKMKEALKDILAAFKTRPGIERYFSMFAGMFLMSQILMIVLDFVGKLLYNIGVGR